MREKSIQQYDSIKHRTDISPTLFKLNSSNLRSFCPWFYQTQKLKEQEVLSPFGNGFPVNPLICVKINTFRWYYQYSQPIFCRYKTGRYTNQCVGMNTMSRIQPKIAANLLYTGYGLRSRHGSRGGEATSPDASS